MTSLLYLLVLVLSLLFCAASLTSAATSAPAATSPPVSANSTATSTPSATSTAVVDVPNYAASFPGGPLGSSSNVALPAFNLTALPFTFEAWVYMLNTTMDYGSIFFARGLSPDISGLSIRTTQPVVNELRSVWENLYTTVSTGLSLSVNTWHHVALVVNSTTRTLYLDQQSFTYPTTAETMDNFTMPAYLGWDPATVTRTFAGLMDEVRIWNTAKSFADLNAAAYGPLVGNEAGLVAYYNFNNQNPTTATDATPHHFNGTINGVTYVSSTVFSQAVAPSTAVLSVSAVSSSAAATSTFAPSAAATSNVSPTIVGPSAIRSTAAVTSAAATSPALTSAAPTSAAASPASSSPSLRSSSVLSSSAAASSSIRSVSSSLPSATSAPTSVPSTVYGSPSNLFSTITQPWGVVYDGLGNLYISETISNVVLKITTSGTLLNTFSFNPPLNSPRQMAIDSLGFLYVVDCLNSRVVKFSSNGTQVANLTATPPLNEPVGVAIDAANNVWIADTLGNRIVQLYPNGTQASVLTTSNPGLIAPSGVTFDKVGALYISDYGNGRILKYTGGVFSTFYSGLYDPTTLVLDASLTAYVLESGNNRVLVISSSSVLVNVLQDLSPPLSYPTGITFVDSSLIVVDYYNYRAVIFSNVISATPSTISSSSSFPPVVVNQTSFVSSSSSVPVPAGQTSFPTAVGPWSVAFDGFGRLFVTESLNSQVVRFTTAGAEVGVIPAISPPLDFPRGLSTDSNYNVYVADTGSNRIVKFSPNGTLLAIFTTTPSLNQPVDVAVDANFNLWIADTISCRIVQLSPNGTQLQEIRTTNPGLAYPAGVAIDASFTLFIADTYNNRVLKRYASGVVVTLYDTGLNNPSAVVVDFVGDCFIADSFNNRVIRVSALGVLLQEFTTSSPSMNYPLGVDLDNFGNLYVADYYNSRIVVFANTTAAVPTSTATGYLCLIFYSLPGTIDYPFSITYSLQLTYDPVPVTGDGGSAVVLLSGSGQRVYTNRFGATLTTNVTLQNFTAVATRPVLRLNSTSPVGIIGLPFTLSPAVELPGGDSLVPVSQVVIYNASLLGEVLESGSSIIDGQGSAFLSNIPGFLNQTIAASNINSLAVNYAQCRAPISFTNGLRAPFQPSAQNGAKTVSYSYFISDGATYAVSTTLTLTTDSAFANSRDELGNNYQTVLAITGRRIYTYLVADIGSGPELVSTVTGIVNVSSTANPHADQHFFPYALLSAAPGVYNLNTGPFLDSDGLTFSVSPAAPANGMPPGVAPLYSTINVALSTATGVAILTESPTATNHPLLSDQRQTYSLD